MAKIGIKGLTYAKYSSGGDGSAMSYTGGKSLDDYLAKADISENRDNIKEHADDHQIDAENALNEVTLALELVNTNDDIKKDFLGHQTTSNTGELVVTGKDAPFVGVGFIVKNRFKGTSTFEGYWFYKVQFSSGGVTANTRKDQTQFDHETINGSVQGVILSSSGDVLYYLHKDGESTESAIRTWLNALAGITSGGGDGVS